METAEDSRRLRGKKNCIRANCSDTEEGPTLFVSLEISDATGIVD